LDAEQLCEFDACAVHPTLDGSDRARANSGSFVIRKTRGCHEDLAGIVAAPSLFKEWPDMQALRIKCIQRGRAIFKGIQQTRER
jgi:hypothetical protein